jgi:hypothetical protein
VTKRSSKRVLDAAYLLVEQWAESAEKMNPNPLFEALKQYDIDRYLIHFKAGVDRLMEQSRITRSQR